jgi:tRNA A37 methylthiotransferase MiaB
LTDDVPRAVRRWRASELRRLCEEKGTAFLRGFDRTIAEVLLERAREPRSGMLRGYTRNYTRVVMPGPDALRGRRVLVRLSVASGHAVTGTVAA